MKIPRSKPVMLIALLVAVVFASCSKTSTSAVYVPAPADVTVNATLAELDQGRTLYVNNCGRCHGLYSPDDFTASQWRSILPGMTPKVGFTSAQTSLVTKYVTRGQ